MKSDRPASPQLFVYNEVGQAYLCVPEEQISESIGHP